MHYRLSLSGLFLSCLVVWLLGGCPPTGTANPAAVTESQVITTGAGDGEAVAEPNVPAVTTTTSGGTSNPPAAGTNDPPISDPNTGDPNSGDPNSADPNSAGGTGDPNSADPNTGDPNTADPNSGDPNGGDPNSADPNDPNTAPRQFDGSGVYQGTQTCNVAQTIYPDDPGAQTTSSTYDQTLALSFDATTGVISGLPVHGYINTPNFVVALAAPGDFVVLSTFDNTTPVTLTVTLTSIAYTSTTIHAVLGMNHYGHLPSGYTETATGVETIDIALSGLNITYTANTTYDGDLSTGSLHIPNRVVIDSSGTLAPQ